MPKWRKLGEGTFNVAYVNEEKTLVFKAQKGILAEDGLYLPQTDLPERSINIWNEINADYPPPAQLYTNMDFDPPISGWVCPFIEGQEASDREISRALLDVFNRSGRIVVDGYVPGNFINSKSGKIVCIDIGMALQLQERENEFFARPSTEKSRRYSVISNEEWKDYKQIYGSFPLLPKIFTPNAVNTTKALLFIKAQRPDIFNVDFLRANKELIKQLAFAYDKSLSQRPGHPEPKEVTKAKEALAHEKPMTLEQLKESCKLELERYIKSRGSLNVSGDFDPSITTKLFRNKALTIQKITAAQNLREQINNLDTAEEIKSAIEEFLEDPNFTQGLKSGDFLGKINKCLFIIKSASEFDLDNAARQSFEQ